MQIITIECITKNEIKISINGEKLTGITAFSLEMKAGETEKYYIEKHIPPLKQQEVPLNNNTTNGQITRWWTIPKVIEVLKKEDPNTAICDSGIRRLVRNELISCRNSGKMILVNVDEIKEYYKNGTGKPTEKIKPFKQKRDLKPIF